MTGKRLSPIRLAIYAAPAFPLAILLLPPYIFLPAFYSQTLGLPLDIVGYIFILARAFDALTDPVIGRLSDTSRGPYGRRKPWILAGTPLAILSVLVLFVPPGDPSPLILAAGMFALTLAWTMMILPYNAWGAELSGDYHERSTISAAREAAALLGTIAALTLPTLMILAGINDPRAHMQGLAAILVLTLLPTVGAALRFVPEAPPLSVSRTRLREGVRAILANKPFRRLIIAYVMNAFANGLPATLFILFVSHVIGAPNAYGPLLLAYFLAGLIAVPFWLFLAARLGKHRTWVIAMSLSCAAFAFTPFIVGEGDVLAFTIISIVSGIGVGADLTLPAAIQADVVDCDTLECGEERTGLFFALWGLATKLALALSGIALPLLHFWDFEADALTPEGRTLNEPSALLALSLLYAALPIALKLVAMSLMWSFPLDAARQGEVRAAIEARARDGQRAG